MTATYEVSISKLMLHDTQGHDMTNYKSIFDSLKDLILKGNSSPKPEDHFHFIWYVISELNGKIAPYETEFINDISKHIPVVVAITQCYGIKKNLANDIRGKVSNSIPIIQVLALENQLGTLENPILFPAKGMDELMIATIKMLISEQQNSLYRATRNNLAAVKEQSKGLIETFSNRYSVTNLPIIALTPLIVSMLREIAKVYCIPIDKESLMKIVPDSNISDFAKFNVTLVPNLFTQCISKICNAFEDAITSEYQHSVTPSLESIISNTISMLQRTSK